MGNRINLPNANFVPLKIEDGRKEEQKTSFNTKNYLDTMIKPGEKEKVVKIRLLPMDLKTGSPFALVYTHNVKIPVEMAKNKAKPYKTYICLSKTNGIDREKYGNKCPFCELNRKAWNESKGTDDPKMKKLYQDISVANIARESVICRCIERGKEDEGVKFWKFNLRIDRGDPYHTIEGLDRTLKDVGENLLDIYTGRDLIVTFRDGEPKPAPTITYAPIQSPLSTDEEQMQKWINDEKKWQDVFTCKPYDYLNLIAQMKIPWFDKETDKWIDKEIHDGNVSESTEAINSQIAAAEKSMNVGACQPDANQRFVDSLELPEETSNDDDLPF